jgi:5-methylcytosine-specific restriction protein A
MPKKPMSLQPPRPRSTPRTTSKLVVLGARGTRKQRGYGQDWVRLRAKILANEPLCRTCRANGKVVVATVVDHIQDIVDRPDLRLEESNLQPLCRRCHNRKTALKQIADRRER